VEPACSNLARTEIGFLALGPNIKPQEFLALRHDRSQRAIALIVNLSNRTFRAAFVQGAEKGMIMKRMTLAAICAGLACPLAIAVATMLSALLVDVPQARAQAAACTPPISSSGCAVGVQIADPSTGQDCVAGSCPAGPGVPFGGDQGTAFSNARSFTPTTSKSLAASASAKP
jgi:hypothetical protein